jgi:hypothetical protein
MIQFRHKRRWAQSAWLEWGVNDTLILRWHAPEHDLAPMLVFSNSTLLDSVPASSFILPIDAPGRTQRIALVAADTFFNTAADYATFTYEAPRGDRLRISIPPASLDTNPDFEGYVIYWSADGSDPTEELDELFGVNNTTCTTPILTEGVTYKFRAKLKDIYGNLSAYGAIVSGTVNMAPGAPSGAAIVYDPETRSATITAEPGSGGGGIVGYELVSNHIQGVGLTGGLTDVVLAYLPSNAVALEHTASNMFAGSWRFAWRAVDATGLRSATTEAAISLIAVDGELTETAIAGAKPFFIDAVSGAGILKVTVHIDEPTEGQVINVYIDGALETTADVIEGVHEYLIETGALTHGQTYAVTASVLTGAVESEQAGPVSATVDGEAPPGDTTLTLELVS